jgi:hypothetical protein
MVMDVAIALAEMVLARRRDYRWALDLDPQNAADEMVSWRPGGAARGRWRRPADPLRF